MEIACYSPFVRPGLSWFKFISPLPAFWKKQV